MAVRAIRTPGYKYVWNPQSVDELYDMKQDPLEMNNRIDDPDCRDVLEQLKGELYDWMVETGDPLRENYRELPPWGTIVSTGEMGP